MLAGVEAAGVERFEDRPLATSPRAFRLSDMTEGCDAGKYEGDGAGRQPRDNSREGQNKRTGQLGRIATVTEKKM